MGAGNQCKNKYRTSNLEIYKFITIRLENRLIYKETDRINTASQEHKIEIEFKNLSKFSFTVCLTKK